MKKLQKKAENDAYLAEQLLIEEVKKDFKRRQEERKSFEAQWQLNMNYLIGNQYCDVSKNGEITDYDKKYFWQSREVYNHIAPIIDSRLSKLQTIRPKMNIIPASNQTEDLKTAEVSKKILESIYNKGDLSKVIKEATNWSEVCGSGFYKISWNSNKGKVVAKTEHGMPVKEGDIEITAVSPFEIYPESSTSKDIESSQSIIHARAYHIDEIKNQWGVETEGEEINVFTLNKNHQGALGSSTKVIKSIRSNYAVVIERYEAPSVSYPNGRLVIVAGDKLVYVGELPYKNGVDESRVFPFVKQDSISQIGCFWGASVIERLIPLQRSYNALKNRKHEFINRLSMGVLTVEDGSVDLENLEEDGLCPGKVLVYRQGSTAPRFMDGDKLPYDFLSDERLLQEEFEQVSGLSDVNLNSYTSRNLSGVALEMILEEDSNRFSATSDGIKTAIKNIAKQILRLYKQFVKLPKLTKLVGANGEMEIFYFTASDITSDDIIFETKNEITDSFTQRRSILFDLIDKKVLTEENGSISKRTKLKILELLGYGIWESADDISEMHKRKASKENFNFMNGEEPKVSIIDDDEIHINEHTLFMLGGDFEKLKIENSKIEEVILEHIKQHKENKKNKEQIQ